jgi:uncharacterized integral membrane protein
VSDTSKVAYEPVSPGAVPDGEVSGRRQVNPRLIVAAVALIVALVFIFQNSERVETTFLVFNVTTRLWVGLLVAVLVGVILGLVLGAGWNRRRRRD